METKLNTEALSAWIGKNERPINIAGPCSAESEDQLVKTAVELSTKKVDLFRAGIWKPRTRPNSFEGVGSVGLQWMQQVKKETGMKIATEVANVKHVYECLKYGVDVLWIGARTSANPFAVQEIADSLKGMDIPVMVKNPVNPDVDLWLGAIERLHAAGITKIAAIHRGFSTYGKSKFRNLPQWQIPIELRRRIKDIPLICDPSHIAGKSVFLQEISQKAMDMNFDGLMIESHIRPEEAMSDKNQQISPKQLSDLMGSLVLRKIKIDDVVVKTNIEELREHIDNLDEELLDTLENRMNIAEIIGQYKLENGITVLQAERWNDIFNERLGKGTVKGLSKEFMERILLAIHQESINRQSAIMNKKLAEKLID